MQPPVSLFDRADGAEQPLSPTLPPTPAAPSNAPPAIASSDAAAPLACATTAEDAERAAATQLVELMGQGTYGAVYRGSYRGKPAAIKVLSLLQETAEMVRAELALMRACA